jgi:hypothetical protein
MVTYASLWNGPSPVSSSIERMEGVGRSAFGIFEAARFKGLRRTGASCAERACPVWSQLPASESQPAGAVAPEIWSMSIRSGVTRIQPRRVAAAFHGHARRPRKETPPAPKSRTTVGEGDQRRVLGAPDGVEVWSNSPRRVPFRQIFPDKRLWAGAVPCLPVAPARSTARSPASVSSGSLAA